MRGLWGPPANLTSYSDVDALVEWVGSEHAESAGGQTTVLKPALTPTLLFPFAAPRVQGSMADAGPRAETEMRVLLWGVEKLVAGLGAIGADTDVDSRLHVVLPGSPNRGIFGGDGAASWRLGHNGLAPRTKSDRVLGRDAGGVNGPRSALARALS